MVAADSLFDLSQFEHAPIFSGCRFAWEALPRIGGYISNWIEKQPLPHSRSAMISEKATIEGDVYIGEGTVVEPNAYIRGPVIIGRNCQVRHGAYIRGGLVTGDNCVIGHDSEIKNGIFLNHAMAAHFAYVGDSILGSHVNLGAGTRLANLPIFSKKDPVTKKRPTITILIEDELVDTGLSKLGSILGDGVQTGCNAVFSPGCVVGKETLVYALSAVRKGYYGPNLIVKSRQRQEIAAFRNIDE